MEESRELLWFGMPAYASLFVDSPGLRSICQYVSRFFLDVSWSAHHRPSVCFRGSPAFPSSRSWRETGAPVMNCPCHCPISPAHPAPNKTQSAWGHMASDWLKDYQIWEADPKYPGVFPNSPGLVNLDGLLQTWFAVGWYWLVHILTPNNSIFHATDVTLILNLDIAWLSCTSAPPSHSP